MRGGRDRGDAAAAEAQLEEGGEAGAEAAGGGVLAVHPGLEVRDPRQVLVPRQRLPAPLAEVLEISTAPLAPT